MLTVEDISQRSCNAMAGHDQLTDQSDHDHELAAHDIWQILSITIAHTTDIQALRKLYGASTTLRQGVTDAIKSRMVQILDEIDPQFLYKCLRNHVQWLLKQAGPDVINSPEVVLALMRQPAKMADFEDLLDDYFSLLVGAGMSESSLTDPVVGCLARHSPINTRSVLDRYFKGTHLSKPYRALAFDWLHPHELQALLPEVTDVNLTDLLHLVCSNHDDDALRVLWQHDADTIHLIQSSTPKQDDNTGSSSGRSTAAGAGAGQETAPVRQQASTLVAQLLETCIRANNSEAAELLATSRAAADLGVDVLLELIAKAACSHGSCSDILCDSLLKIPAASNLPVAFLSMLLHCCLVQRQIAARGMASIMEHCGGTAAAAVTSGDLCQALTSAVKQTGWKLQSALCCDSPDDVMQELVPLKLPCVQDVPPAFIISTLRKNILQPHANADTLKALLQLPAATAITGEDLCPLIVQAVQRAERNSHSWCRSPCLPYEWCDCYNCQLVERLANCLRLLPRGALTWQQVTQLVKCCIDSPDICQRYFGVCFQDFPIYDDGEPLHVPLFNPNDHITSRGTLELLEYYSTSEERLTARQHIKELLSCLDDDNKSIEDSETFSKVLLAVAKAVTDTDTITPLLGCAPAVYDVERKTWFEVLQCMLNSQLQGIPPALLELPAVQEFNSKQVAALVQLAEEKGNNEAVESLAKLSIN